MRFGVYSHDANPVSIANLESALARAGRSVTWEESLAASKPGEWKSGYVYPTDVRDPRQRVDLSTEQLNDLLRRDLMRAYSNPLTASQRELAASARAYYAESREDGIPLLLQVVGALAELAGGIIVDDETSKVLTREEFGKAYERGTR